MVDELHACIDVIVASFAHYGFHAFSSWQEAKAHREKELKKAEEDLNKIKKKAEESTKTMKAKQQVICFHLRHASTS